MTANNTSFQITSQSQFLTGTINTSNDMPYRLECFNRSVRKCEEEGDVHCIPFLRLAPSFRHIATAEEFCGNVMLHCRCYQRTRSLNATRLQDNLPVSDNAPRLSTQIVLLRQNIKLKLMSKLTKRYFSC